jgi:hypothetical protein
LVLRDIFEAKEGISEPLENIGGYFKTHGCPRETTAKGKGSNF